MVIGHPVIIPAPSMPKDDLFIKSLRDSDLLLLAMDGVLDFLKIMNLAECYKLGIKFLFFEI
jgi:hypothetical protein